MTSSEMRKVLTRTVLLRKVLTRKVLLRKVLNLKLGFKVVLTARCIRRGIENIAPDNLVRLG